MNAAGSGTRLSAARIEAAAKAAYEWDADTNAGRTWDDAQSEGVADWYRELVRVGFAAADVVEASEVARLRTALTELVSVIDEYPMRAGYLKPLEKARDALAESVPSPQKDATK